MDTSLIWEKVNGQGLVNFRYLMDNHWLWQLLKLSEQSIFRGLQSLLTTAPVFRGDYPKFVKNYMDKFVDKTSQI